MSGAGAVPPVSSGAPLAGTVALISLSARTIRRGWLPRVGRLYAWGSALSSAAVLAWTLSHGEADAVPRLLSATLGWLSFPAGLVACAAARDLDAEERALGLSALAGLRGFGEQARSRARVVATLWVVASGVGLPALMLAASAVLFSPTVRTSVSFVPWLLGIAMYSAVFGVVFGAIARAAALLSRAHGRLVFLFIVLVPEVLRGVLGDVPSAIAAFGWLVHRVAQIGGIPA